MSTSHLRRKFSASIAAVGASVLLLAACSSSSDPDPSESSAAPPPDSSVPITLVSSGDADITQGQGKALTDIIASFTADTGIETTLDRIPFDQYLVTATTRARAGELGDAVEMLPGANFSSLFPAVTDMQKSDIEGADALSGWAATVKDPENPDVFAGAPIGAQGTLFYYNKALFEQAGLDPETPPATWDELLDALGALKSAGIAPLGMSGADSFLLWWAWSALSPQFFSPDDVNMVRSGEIKLNDQRFADSLEPLLQTYEMGYWNEDYAGLKFTDVEAAFAAGEVAIVPGIISNAMNWQVWDDKLGTDAYGVFNAPQVAGTTLKGQFFNPVLMYGVNVDSENPGGALELINAMVSKEGQTKLLEEASQFPNRTDVDVVGITGSSGAGAILDIVKRDGGVDVAQNQFNGAAQSASWTNLTETMKSGDIAGFLDDLERQQRS